MILDSIFLDKNAITQQNIISTSCPIFVVDMFTIRMHVQIFAIISII